MNRILTAFLFLLSSATLFGQNTRFAASLEEGSLHFKMPENFDTIAVRNNQDMSYELAIKSKTDSFEIRYAIRPLGKRIENFEKWLQTLITDGRCSPMRTPIKVTKLYL